ncbi:LytTR family DNA-binding domain-containing protein [Fulvivirgaceae bacterium PWU4]|uniref:LytTR family DNA-binding domain-containing protein n=1 Tax=Chryseosolibacter histidini TaxID=2782349 RepID=A0AAP2GQ53_9BACT|nr:LytTR family DNA-binding domain-containing protein [Chryseosolibacter histidini]MBT1699803.1 LytTR family DNA-binding domain-containing protein [Chryseosolibacter histidini]
MNKLSCLLVDDEPPALEILRSYICSTPTLRVAGECNHAVAAFEFLQQHHVDLIFLDICLPQVSGTEFLKALTNPPKVIFTTAHRDFAVEGFELGAADYLLKPYSLERFWRAVQRVTSNERVVGVEKEKVVSESERFLYVRADRKMVKVMVDEILYIESLKDYVKIFLPGGQVITKQTITALEEMLPEDDFIRIHRSFIASRKKIASYTQTSAFIGKVELPVGPLYRHLFLQKIKG